MVKNNRIINLPGGTSLDFSGPALVMAIVNCNEDSFYAPSRALRDDAVEKALLAQEDGASIIDFGGESSRPGSVCIGEDEELERVIPVLSAFRKRSRLPVSVDTRKAAVARAALDAGADIINDISSLGDPLMASVCAERGAAVVLMHWPGLDGGPAAAQGIPGPGDIAAEVGAYLASAAERAVAAGISREKIIVDPGIGFGKTFEDTLEILRRFPYLAEICGKDYPLMVGLSRKSFIGKIIGRAGMARDAAGRLAGTLAVNGAAIMGGADIIRVHDVREHVDLAKMLFVLRPQPSLGQ
ncbi:MAG: dihydropteroate synthase [Treponema sp.]|nr:dihydropteroate synthase [Treponema sp.]